MSRIREALKAHGYKLHSEDPGTVGGPKPKSVWKNGDHTVSVHGSGTGFITHWEHSTKRGKAVRGVDDQDLNNHLKKMHGTGSPSQHSEEGAEQSEQFAEPQNAREHTAETTKAHDYTLHKAHGSKDVYKKGKQTVHVHYGRHPQLPTIEHVKSWEHSEDGKNATGTGHHLGTLSLHLMNRMPASQHAEEPASLDNHVTPEKAEQFMERGHYKVFNNGGAGFSVKHKATKKMISAFGRNKGRHTWTGHPDNAAVFNSHEEAHEAASNAEHPEEDEQFSEEPSSLNTHVTPERAEQLLSQDKIFKAHCMR